MNHASMKIIYVLFSLYLLSSARTTSISTRSGGSTSTQSLLNSLNNHRNSLKSVCPTVLQMTEVRTAVHFFNRKVVHLARDGQSRKFSLGSCRSTEPIMSAPGICSITMQRHRTYIRVTETEATKRGYNECRPVERNSNLKDCLEWIELPGLCQHKIAL